MSKTIRTIDTIKSAVLKSFKEHYHPKIDWHKKRVRALEQAFEAAKSYADLEAILRNQVAVFHGETPTPASQQFFTGDNERFGLRVKNKGGLRIFNTRRRAPSAPEKIAYYRAIQASLEKLQTFEELKFSLPLSLSKKTISEILVESLRSDGSFFPELKKLEEVDPITPCIQVFNDPNSTIPQRLEALSQLKKGLNENSNLEKVEDFVSRSIGTVGGELQNELLPTIDYNAIKANPSKFDICYELTNSFKQLRRGSKAFKKSEKCKEIKEKVEKFWEMYKVSPENKETITSHFDLLSALYELEEMPLVRDYGYQQINAQHQNAQAADAEHQGRMAGVALYSKGY